MAAQSAIYSQAPATFNWLDAMSTDKAFFDPRHVQVPDLIFTTFVLTYLYRTSELHRFPIPSQGLSYPMDDLDITDPALVTPKPIKASVTTWIEERMNNWENQNFELQPTNTEAKDNDDDESVMGMNFEHLQLEALPTSREQAAGNSLLSLHDQIQPSRKKQHQSSSRAPAHQTRPVQQTETRQTPRADDPVLFHPILIDPVLESSAYTFSDSTSSSASSAEENTQNIGKLIANKVRIVAAHGASTCRTLRKKLSLREGRNVEKGCS